MSSRKPPPDSQREDGPPFNNPFADALEHIKEGLPVSAPPRSTLPDKRQRSAKGGQAESEAAEQDQQDPQDPIAAKETFLAAVGEVERIDHDGDRLRSPQSVQIGGIASSHESDLQEMAALSGFDPRFSDQYIRASAAGVSRQTVEKLARGEFSVRSHLDLHGMILDDAMREVDDFIAERQRRGERCVLVVTGKGQNSKRQVGVLRSKIPEWLSRGPSSRRILAFVTARPCDGGEGALYVLLRKVRSGKTRIDMETGGVG